jgi:GAF domain-containing protein
MLPLRLREQLEIQFKGRVAPSERELQSEAQRISAEISGLCQRDHLDRVVREAMRCIAVETTGRGVINQVFQAVHALLGSVDVLFYGAKARGGVSLLFSTRPTASAAVEVFDRGEGHVERVILQRVTKIAADLINDPDGFVQVAGRAPAKFAITVPSEWDAQGLPAALQVTGTEPVELTPHLIRAIEVLGEVAGIAWVKIARRTGVPAPVPIASDWHWRLLDVAIEPDETAVHILERKRKLYNFLAQKALSVSRGSSACVRILDPRTRKLRFVSVVGPQWTEALKQRVDEETPSMSADLRATQEGGPYLYEPDVDKAPAFHRVLPDTKSLCAIPFSIRGRKYGVLTIDWDKPNGANTTILRRLQALVKEFASVLEVLIAREQGIFQALENSIADRADWYGVLAEVVEQLRRTLNAKVCSLFLQYPGENMLKLAATTSIGAEEPPEYELGQGLTGWVAQQRSVIRVQNARNADELKTFTPVPQHFGRWKDIPDADSSGRLSYLGVPMVSRDELIGVLRVSMDDEEREFSVEQEHFLQDAANRIARAIDAVWMAQHATRQMESQSVFQSRLARAHGLAEICDVLLDGFLRLQGACGGYIKLDDLSGRHPGVETAAGVLKSFQVEPGALIVVSGPEHSANFGSELCWPELHAWVEKTFKDSPAAVGAVARIPITFHSDTIRGTLGLCWRTSQRFDEGQKQELDRLTQQVALATEPSFEQLITASALTRLKDELRSLRKVEDALALDWNHEALLNEILDLALRESGMDKGTIRFFDPGRRVWTLKAPAEPSPERKRVEIETDCVLQRTLESKEAVFVENTDGDELWIQLRNTTQDPEVAQYLHDVRSSLHIPLRLHPEYIGAILLDSTTSKSPSPDAFAFLAALAHHAAVAIKINSIRELAEPLAMMGAMLSDFLHAFRTPLATALATFELLELPNFPASRIPQELTDLRTTIERIRNMCSRLELSIGRGQTAMDDEISVNELLDAVLSDIAPRRAGSAKIVSAYADSSPSFRGNSLLVEIALKMIIQNAFEAMPEGGTLTVTTKDKGDSVEISFRDTGIGMDEFAKARCLVPFFTTKKIEDGATGLGLPVAHGIVKRHGGNFRFESEPGKGSTFSMLFRRS